MMNKVNSEEMDKNTFEFRMEEEEIICWKPKRGLSFRAHQEMAEKVLQNFKTPLTTTTATPPTANAT